MVAPELATDCAEAEPFGVERFRRQLITGHPQHPVPRATIKGHKIKAVGATDEPSTNIAPGAVQFAGNIVKAVAASL